MELFEKNWIDMHLIIAKTIRLTSYCIFPQFQKSYIFASYHLKILQQIIPPNTVHSIQLLKNSEIYRYNIRPTLGWFQWTPFCVFGFFCTKTGSNPHGLNSVFALTTGTSK